MRVQGSILVRGDAKRRYRVRGLKNDMSQGYPVDGSSLLALQPSTVTGELQVYGEFGKALPRDALSWLRD